MRRAAVRWLARHPYTVTSLVFFGAILMGWLGLGWGERQLAFVVLLYFIVAIGVRLDEIFRAIGGPSAQPAPPSADPETILSQLREIRELLRRIEEKL
ncbi:MAG: hypothetical protein WHT06_02375 [Desulfobacterales bacterium]